jgi:Dolichyl-phosphate-mannose-protein mannosyltransferase
MATVPRASRRDLLTIAVLVAMVFVARLLFLYHDATPDPDSLMMAAGMAIDLTSDLPRGDTLLYGRHVGPGAFIAMRYTYPLFFDEPSHVVAFLNASAVVLSTLTAIPLYLLARRRLARAAAAGAVAVWALNPVAWESGTYFHTVVACTFLLLVAMECACRVDATRKGRAWYAATALVAMAAFVTRTEIVFAFPALLVWTLSSKRPRRDTLLFLSIAAFALAAYALVFVLFSSDTTIPSGGFRAYFRWYATHFAPREWVRSTTWAVLSLGVASLAAVALALARRPRAGPDPARLRGVVFGLAWVLPSFLFWVLTPVPVLRHYYLATLGVAWLFGVLVLQRARPRRAMALAAGVVALNLALPEALYAGYRALSGVRKTPHGTFFSAHAYWNARISRFVRLRQEAVSCAPERPLQSPDVLAVITWEGAAHLIYQLGASGYRVDRVAKESIYPGVHVVDFAVGTGGLRIVQYIYFEDPVLRLRVAGLVEEARLGGRCVVVPDAFAPLFGIADGPHPRLVRYSIP